MLEINPLDLLKYLIVDLDVSSEQRLLPLVDGAIRVAGAPNQVQATFDYVMPDVVLLEVQTLKLGPPVRLKVQLQDDDTRGVPVADRENQRLVDVLVEDKEFALVRKVHQLLRLFREERGFPLVESEISER